MPPSATFRPVRAALVVVLSFLLGACAGFENALAVTATHKGDVGGRAALGMPRGDAGWVTQLVLAGDSGGFGAAAAGVAWRKPTGLTPRFEVAAGVASRAWSFSGDCTFDDDGNQSCENGIGPYGELNAGLDVPLGAGAPALTFGVGGTLYQNSEDLEPRVLFSVGVAWK